MKTLLVASGLSAREIDNYPYKQEGWKIIAVNNGWLACDTTPWDFWIRSNDFNGHKPKTVTYNQVVVPSYGRVLDKFGGQKVCGYSITLNAAYWTLGTLKPSIIAFLGADMNYNPSENGHTHIYGIGNDIKAKGIPDPDRMVIVHGDGKPEYLKRIYQRFEEQAIKMRCRVYNFSSEPNTRLPYKQIKPQNINRSKG